VTSPGIAFPVPEIDDTVDIKDFTIKQKQIKFKIDNDIFAAHAILGLPLMQDMVKLGKSIGNLEGDEKFDGIFEIFDKLLTPDSSARFKQRAQSIGEDGIDVKRQLIPILYFLLETYGVRPTQQSSDSSTGLPSETDGTSSTAGQPVTA
jgi:hypothetical protein